MAGYPGKRGRAVNLNTNLTAPTETGNKTESQDNKSNTDHVPIVEPEMPIVNLYAVGHELRNIKCQKTKPFIHELNIIAHNGKAVEVQASFDDGALVDAMSMTKFNQIRNRLGHYSPSLRQLRMADGSIVKAIATWEGEMEIKGVMTRGSFEVFDSGNNWDFLFGKTLLTAFNAVHDYKVDEVTVESGGNKATLKNQFDMGPPGDTMCKYKRRTRKYKKEQRNVPVDKNIRK